MLVIITLKQLLMVSFRGGVVVAGVGHTTMRHIVAFLDPERGAGLLGLPGVRSQIIRRWCILKVCILFHKLSAALLDALVLRYFYVVLSHVNPDV